MMDRRTVVALLAGTAGAGVTIALAASRDGTATSASGVSSATAPLRFASVAPIRSVTVTQIPIGGGGFITGIDASADGNRHVCRTDVANGYVRDSIDAAWRPLFSPASLQRADYSPLPALNGKADGGGVSGVRIAPSNRDAIVATYYGYVWLSSDGGRTFTRTGLPQKAMPSNAGAQRLFNRTVDIHPKNADRFIVGTAGEGAWWTGDRGASWAQLPLPQAGKSRDGQPGLHLVLYDPVRPTRVYVFVSGVGLCLSEQGEGGSFALLPGGPTHASNLVAGPDGSAYLCEMTSTNSGRVWRHHPSRGWSNGKPEHEAHALAIDPANSSHLIAVNPNGFFMESDDFGATWTSLSGAAWSSTAGEVGWTRALKSFFPAELLIDSSGRLIVAQGVGVATGTIRGSSVSVKDWSAGIEELCAVTALAVPGGKVFLSGWDKPIWRVDDWTRYANAFHVPVAKGQKQNADTVVYGSYLDYAPDDPRVLVGVVAATGATGPGITRDGGDTWQMFAGQPQLGWGNGGCIAASTSRNFVLLPSNNAAGAFTLDGGATWSPIRLDGVNPTTGFANSFFVTRKNVTADKTAPGTFALVYTVVKGDGYGEPLGGVWLTRDGGQTWTHQLRGVISDFSSDPRQVRAKGQEERQFWQCQLEYVPGRRGELVYTPHADYTDDRFYWSRDDGRTWQEVHSAIRNVRSFGFGKALGSAERPALYFWGEIDKRPGLYVSFDWGRSKPTLVVENPSPMLATVSCVAGDMGTFCRVYLGTSCAGWLKIDLAV